MSLKELQKLAEPLFEKYGVNKLYGTSDGNIFLLHNRALLHAGKTQTVYTLNKEKTVLKSENDTPTSTDGNNDGAETFKSDNAATTGADAKTALSVKEIQASVKDKTDVEELKQMLLHEVSGLNRKSAVEAIEKKIEALVNPKQ